MTTGVDHVLLTRFNLPSGGVEERIRARDGWLRDRVVLFERYCVPSVLGQVGPRPRWLVYLDPHSPTWLLERMTELERDDVLTPVLREEVPRDALLADLARVVPEPGTTLVTTNLDNDDGLAADFSRRVRAAGEQHQRCAVYLVDGLVATPDRLYLRRDRVNAFCSVRESWHSPVTAWSGYHNELGRMMPTVEVGGGPGWLQVVHGSNVSNRVRGRLVDPAPYVAAFPGLDVPAVPRREVLRDAAVGVPLRTVRDAGRGALRSAGLRLLGKDGYSAARLATARALHRS